MSLKELLTLPFDLTSNFYRFIPPANEGYVLHVSFCLWGGAHPSMPCRFEGPHPRGTLRGLARGISRATPRGKLRGLALGVSRPAPRGRLRVWLGTLQAHIQGVSKPTPGGSVGPHLGVSRPTPGGDWCIPACTEADPPVGCMHPTGMHSCELYF